MPNHRKLLTFLLAAVLGGCAVGPDFQQPAAPPVKGYTAEPILATAGRTNVNGGEVQRLLDGGDLAADWWTLFHCPALTTLIERSLKANPNLKAAQAALVAARENVKAQRGAYYPSLSGSFGGSRQHTSSIIAPVPNNNAFSFDLYTPQLSVSYVPDVWGLNRRTVESLAAQAEQARFAWIASDIALSANVAAAAIQEASLREQIGATRELIRLATNSLSVLKTQFAGGYASRLDVAAQEALVAQALATLPPLQKQLDQNRDLMAVLAGGYAAEGPAETFLSLSNLTLPQDLPLSLPSKLVEQRPDVRQAEENWRQANAQVGIAEANRLPNIMLSADLGSDALAWGQIFSSGTGFWALAGSATQPIFQGGTLLHRQRAAQALSEQASEQYKATVQTAFQNVADSLVALKQDAAALSAAAAARDAAKVTLDLSKQQYKAGYATYLSLLSAEQAYDQALITFVQTQASRYADTVALFQALGGGWWHRADLTKN